MTLTEQIERIDPARFDQRFRVGNSFDLVSHIVCFTHPHLESYIRAGKISGGLITELCASATGLPFSVVEDLVHHKWETYSFEHKDAHNITPREAAHELRTRLKIPHHQASRLVRAG